MTHYSTGSVPGAEPVSSTRTDEARIIALEVELDDKRKTVEMQQKALTSTRNELTEQQRK